MRKLRQIHIDLLMHYADGLTLRQAAEKLHRSHYTVMTYSEEIRMILKANSLAHAMVIAIKKRIIEL